MIGLDSLTPSQEQAVKTTHGPVLVVASAGSGKTKTLTYRLAYILHEGLASCQEILALTFTRKAALEMRQRTLNLLKDQVVSVPLLTTFHGWGVWFLRQEGYRVGLTPDFTILDEDDQLKFIKDFLKKHDLDRHIEAQAFQSFIDQVTSGRNFINRPLWEQALNLYQKELLEKNCADFSHLLKFSWDILNQFSDARQSHQERFRFILVDEYQDTNPIQNEILKVLSKKHGNICAVGDEDQSIYGWRGATIDNILRFEQNFPGAQVIFLGENFRSTRHIVLAARSVIEKNRYRKPKPIETRNDWGQRVQILTTNDEWEEVFTVLRVIQRLRQQGVSWNQMAIIYRTHALSRLFEQVFSSHKIPYRLFGGFRFFERQEIKDVLAYLKVLISDKDDLSWERVLMTPPKGIGQKSLESLKSYGIRQSRTLGQVLGELKNLDLLKGSKKKTLVGWFEVVARYRESYHPPLSLFVKNYLTDVGYLGYLENEQKDRLPNVESFISLLAQFDNMGNLKDLSQLIQDWVQFGDEDLEVSQNSSDAVILTTAHLSKGLEFDVVFVVGCEQGLFPSQLSLEEGHLEEERRLMYVSMTRARKQLYLTWARKRTIWGKLQHRHPSLFLMEIHPQHADGLEQVFSQRLSPWDDFF